MALKDLKKKLEKNLSFHYFGSLNLISLSKKCLSPSINISSKMLNLLAFSLCAALNTIFSTMKTKDGTNHMQIHSTKNSLQFPIVIWLKSSSLYS